ncbi:hypothetical protein NJO91_17570 [Streptomyces microflavus]|uniref:hypothetical protein n=1 Tax=Streptomyces microflavus TaxID=1919 RepID=UPI0029AF7787|nr:hypothetical protein [Streptomyces microflavus]MDX2404916.1 hypothetical protein [Streptomyces microflavus]
MDILKMLEQLDKLIADGLSILHESEWHVNFARAQHARVLTNRLEAAVERVALPGSVYIQQLDQHRTKPLLYKMEEVLSVAVGLRDDLSDGWTESVAELVHAETHSDYLEMAESLLSSGYKDPAAVIVGTALEVHVRALCVKHGVDTELPTSAPKKADTMNAELKKAGVYGTLQQKQLTAWMDLRNKAAHGDWKEYDIQQVRLLIDGVREFMLKFPA